MPKEKIFSKLKYKDYNNLLEQVLEKKDFSSTGKNLILSVLYKMETKKSILCLCVYNVFNSNDSISDRFCFVGIYGRLFEFLSIILSWFKRFICRYGSRIFIVRHERR